MLTVRVSVSNGISSSITILVPNLGLLMKKVVSLLPQWMHNTSSTIFTNHFLELVQQNAKLLLTKITLKLSKGRVTDSLGTSVLSWSLYHCFPQESKISDGILINLSLYTHLFIHHLFNKYLLDAYQRGLAQSRPSINAEFLKIIIHQNSTVFVFYYCLLNIQFYVA